MRLAGRGYFHIHYVGLGLLAIGLILGSSLTKLPLRFAWGNFLFTYWFGLAFQSLILAPTLFLLRFPLKPTLAQIGERYRCQKSRILPLAIFLGLMAWEFGWAWGVVLTVLTVGLLEALDRAKWDFAVVYRWAKDVSPPAAYLFAGLVLVFAYNDLIAATRFTGAYDAAFLRMDAWILRGGSVSEISHRVLHAHPGLFDFLEVIYFRMFPQIGAALAITAFCGGRKEAFRFACTVLTAYYLALLAFAIWPSMGPFFTCRVHFAEFPTRLTTTMAQWNFLAKASLLWQHRPIDVIDTDFYIAFPCMHIAQPMIVLWYLRGWRKVTIFLLLYDVLLVPAILLLEWHYVVDLIGGILVAGLAIALNSRRH